MSGMVLISVTRVVGDPDAEVICLISCFFLSNSCLPSRSLMVSLYCDQR